MTESPNPNIVDTDSLTGEMHPIRRVVVALGSNLGERFAALQGAVDALADTPDFFVTGVSPVYETDPVDSPEDAGPFLNAVVLADTTLPAARLMERALAIEDVLEAFLGQGHDHEVEAGLGVLARVEDGDHVVARTRHEGARDPDLPGGETGGDPPDPLDRHLLAVAALALENVAEAARGPDPFGLVEGPLLVQADGGAGPPRRGSRRLS